MGRRLATLLIAVCALVGTACIGRFATWPPDELATAYTIEGCESTHGEDPRAYDLNAGSGGIMQIDKETWADFFAREYGWTWTQIVQDDVLNHRAARVVWDRAGGSWQPWSACVP